MIGSGSWRNQLNASALIDQAQRLSWNTQADFKFRADRNPFDKPSEVIGQEFVFLVATVEADFFSQQAGGNADPNAGMAAQSHSAPPNIDCS
jgi:hypothetical protein